MSTSDPVAAQIGQWQRTSLMVGIAGALLAITGFLLDREQFLRSYLFGYLFWLGMAIGCLGILLLHHTVGGKWGMLIRRMCEAGARTIPYMIVLLIPIFLNLSGALPVGAPRGRARSCDSRQGGLLEHPRCHWPRCILLRYLDAIRIHAEQMVDRTGSYRR